MRTWTKLVKATAGLTLAAAMLTTTAGCKGKPKEGEVEATEKEPATKEKGGPATPANMKESKVAVPTAGELAKKAKGGSAETAARFTRWTPVPSFLSSPVAGGTVVSSKEAIVFTKDNHVGVTTDGGVSWAFARHATGWIRTVAGKPGGPYVAVGVGGFMAVSTDGKAWSDLPRYTNEDLVGAAVDDKGIAAAGRAGGVIKTDQAGSNARSSVLPNKFKASGVAFMDGKLVAFAGKKGFETDDGETWTPTVNLPVAKGKESPTSRGLCALGKVGKKRGVVCTVAGTAYGIAENQAVVVGKSWIAVTKDGNTWGLAPLPMKSIKGIAGKAGGPISVYDAKGAIATTSDGGKTWKENTDAATIADAPQFGKPGKCDGKLPPAGEACQLTKTTTSPAALPDVGSVIFDGNTGLAMGAFAMAAMTADGGATWESTSGFNLGGLSIFDVRGDRVAACGKQRCAASTDAGKTFHSLDFPPKSPAAWAAHIAEDGALYLSGKGGLILKSEGDLTSFTKLDTGDKNKTDYLALFEVGKVVYAAGSRGELHRSRNAGKSWSSIATGVPEVVQRMSGEGEVVLALTSAGRFGGNKLLRSNDGGVHFVVQRELSEKGAVQDFEFSGGVIRLGNLASTDFGATWTRAAEWYWPGSTDIGDGSGMRLTNVRSYNGKDRFYVIGPQKDDFTIIDSFFNTGGNVRCSGTSGCWLLASGQVYQPR